jgi:hypothetical protein
MRSTRFEIRAALLLTALGWVIACSDVGDSSAVPVEGADAADATKTVAAGSDAEDEAVEASPQTGATDTGTPATSTSDTGPAEVSEAGLDSTISMEMGSPDTGGPDETSTPDAGGPDSAGGPDTGGPETGGPPDTGAPEAGGSGMDSGGGSDSAAGDSSVEAGLVDAGAGDATKAEGGGTGTGPTPCVTAPCASTGPNSVECSGSANNVCTPTEAVVVDRDIAKGNLTGGQLTPFKSCYGCLVNNGGLDDTTGDHGHECGDVTGSATLTGELGSQACLDTLSCIIAQQCATSDPVAECLCGTAAGTACLDPGAANGPCLQNEINGLDIGTGTTLGTLTEGDPTATQKAFKTTTLGSGLANSIMGFAYTNCQTECTP